MENQNNQSKINILKTIYLPILISIGILFSIYSLLNYLIIIKYKLIEPNVGLVKFFIPILLTVVLSYFYIRPKINFIVFKNGDKKGDLTYLFIFIIAIPFIIFQHYLDTKGGELTQVKHIYEIVSKPKTKYYQIEDFFLLRKFGSLWVSSDVTGRYGTELSVTASLVCPLVDTVFNYNKEETWKVWFAKNYHKTFNYKKSETMAGQNEINEFIDKSVMDFKLSDFSQEHFFSRISNSDERKNYVSAIERFPFGTKLSKEVVILRQEKGDYNTRNGSSLFWFLGTFLLGQIIVLFIILNHKLNKKSLLKYEKLNSSDKIKNALGFLIFLVPNKKSYVTPILFDINIIVFLLMVFSGVSIIHPNTKELLNWGGII
ncbi:membrane hypothetical protein [uncultured Paludibacter sp.]|uniref:Uncharacterized protein n=1 Tax=uncultured Paludibacter sp. TaxID=497635 RepID=A0A653AKJ9_9BACT|nr:membrane hypothetical protein [uncultured Paludibacter sp.]